MSATTAITLSNALCSGRTTALALIDAAFDEIAQKDPQLKAFIEKLQQWDTFSLH